MVRLLGWLGMLAMAGAGGCLQDGPYRHPEPEYDPATTQTSSRVDSTLRAILAANPGMPIRPMLHAIGKPEAALFHRGDGELFISQGMVERCQNEGQLAAVLCSELGQMETERQASNANEWRETSGSPYDPGLPVSSVGSGDQPDMTRTAELAKFEQSRRERSRPTTVADPRDLARLFLERAGHDVALLDEVEPWIREARRGRQLEMQFTRPFNETP